MVNINNLEVKYGTQVALSITSPISFNIGDRIGIIGSNGAGKTTLVKSILGLTKYNGSINCKLKPEEMSVHMQQNEYADTVPVKYIIEAVLNTSIKKNSRLQELITFFDFEKCLNKKFSTLSGGQKQRLTIIMVLIQDSPLVFFDEVTSGLDFETRQQLMSKISKWYENKNATICLVSHYYEELEQLVNKILILEKGRVVDFGSKEGLFKKYCGEATITVENNEKNSKILKEYSKILSPKHLIAFSCENEAKEVELVKILIKNDINFKRSNSDIEIMSINAKALFNARSEGGRVNE